jgi:hypothetical protein
VPIPEDVYVLPMTASEAASVHGTVEPGFEGVRAAFEDNFAVHGDVGASVAITVGGRMVVDLWGGVATFDGLVIGNSTAMAAA